LRGFLGLAGYYKQFVKDFGLICRPLHDMLKKHSFMWTEEQTTAFNMLKRSLTTAPVMALPNFSLSFTLETDACGTGIGAVLMQQGKPISYFNKTLGVKNAACLLMIRKHLLFLKPSNGGDIIFWTVI
jgi:hypothetical protein